MAILVSDQRRRQFCRAAFLLFALIPTILVAYVIATRPSRIDYQKSLTDQMGVPVSIGVSATPSPGKQQIQNLEVRIPASHQGASKKESLFEIWRLAMVDVDYQQSSILADVGTTSISVGGFRSLLEQLKRRQLTSATSPRPFRLTCQRLNLKNGPIDPPTQALVADLHDFEFQVFPSRNGWQANLHFSLEEGDPKRVSVQYELEQSEQGPIEKITLETGEGKLPVSILGQFIPDFQSLGSTATFQGSIRSTNERNQKMMIKGSIWNIDLTALIQKNTEFEAQGKVDCKLVDCRVVDGKITSLTGQVAGRKGALAAELLHRLGSWPDFSSAGNQHPDTNALSPRQNQSLLAYADLAFAFKIERSKLVVWSIGPSQQVLVSDSDRQALFWLENRGSGTITITQLLQALFPAPLQSIPVHTNSVRLFSRFAQ